jgi:integrase
MASFPDYLIVRNGVFSYRRRVPATLRHRPEFGGKEVFQVSLGVRSISDARREVQRRELDALFEPHLRATTKPENGTVLSVALLRQIADDNYRRGVRSLSDERASESREALDDLAAHDVGTLNNPTTSSRAASIVRKGMADALRAQAEGVAAKLGIDATEEALAKIEDALFQSEKALLGARVDMAGGNPFPAWSPEGSVNGTGTRAPTVKEAHWTFKRMMEAALKQRQAGPSWADKVRTNGGLFAAHIGPQTAIHEIDKRMIRDFLADLAFMPKSMSLRFPNMTLTEAIAANEALDKPFPTVTPNTIRDGYFSVIRWVLSYAVELDAIPMNPVAGMKVTGANKGRRATRKPTFRVDELNALFRQPLFAGCRSEDRPNTPGNFHFDDHRKWTPLLMLYSGARPSELAQLAVSDVRGDNAIPYISILTEYDPNDPDDRDFVLSHKTENARREIPIHPELVDLGFLEYVRERRDAGDIRLFPGWAASRDARKLYSSARWIRNLNEVVIPAITARKPKPTLYSLRHTWKTLLAEQRVPAQYQNQLIGHAQAGMDEHYLHEISIERLYEAIKDIKHAGLDIRHLNRGA